MEMTARMVGGPERGATLLREALAWQATLTTVANEAADVLRTTAMDESPIGKEPRGRRFRDSWITEVTPQYQGGARVVLSNIAPHTPFVIWPTKPHDIWANHMLGRTASTSGARPIGGVAQGLGYLRFQGRGGGFVFRHHVHHPGTHGNDIPGRVDSRMQPRYAAWAEESAVRFTERLGTVFA